MLSEKQDEIEINLLLEAIFQCYRYDFRNYARSSLKRRLEQRLSSAKLRHYSEMIPRIFHEPGFFDALLQDLSVTVTEMFRDPSFYKALREQVIPTLKTYPFVKIWHAGCATGEEVYSMAILLEEESFLDRAKIYATDYNDKSLAYAKEGIYPEERFELFAENYKKAGGRSPLDDFFHIKYGRAKIRDGLKKNIHFSHHNLATDGVFGEMNLVICRNVVIYFDRELQNRVFNLFCESLGHRGYLALGSKETIDFSIVSEAFNTLSLKDKIYQKIK